MKILLLLLLAILVGGCGGCASLPPGKPAYRAAVRIEFAGGNCSATVVGPYTLLSAGHCFTEPGESGVFKVNGEVTEYAVIANDGKDHVLVRIGRRQSHVARIGSRPKRGQMLSLIGNPLGFYSLLRMGRVAGWEDGAKCIDGSEGCRIMLADLETAGGDSGGGYFNARGEVVGVHAGTMRYLAWSLAYSYPLAFLPSDYAKIQ